MGHRDNYVTNNKFPEVKDMSHKKCCKVHLTDKNQTKRIFRRDIIAFCNQTKSFPVGKRVCSGA